SAVVGGRAANACATMLIVCVGLAVFPACASHRAVPDSLTAGMPSHESLGSYITRIRDVSSAAKPTPSLTQTIESSDPLLSAALTQLAASPTAENHRRVASEYRRVRVLDLAHKHLSAAVQLDPRDAAAFDGLARIWRDWGFPQLGLGD